MFARRLLPVLALATALLAPAAAQAAAPGVNVTDIGYDADVTQGTEVVGTAPDGEVQHHGPCSVTAFPWDFAKPGGQGH